MLFFHDNKRVFFYLIVEKNRCANVFGGKIIKNIWNTQVFKRKILKNVILHLCCVFLRIMNFPEDIPKISRKYNIYELRFEMGNIKQVNCI